MKTLPEIFRKYLTQLWYVVLTPVMFFIIMGVYRPFGNPEALNMGRSLFVFNVTIMMCIMLVFLIISRSIFYALRKYLCNNLWQFIGWIIVELAGMTFFVALYLTLMSGEGSYFFNLAISLQYTFLILIVPYGGITAVFVIISLNTSNVREIESVKFTDKNGQVKIVVLKDAILYIKANENYITVFYTEGNVVKDYTLRTSMLAITPIADRFGLFRCHKSYFVNPSHIIALRKDVNETYAAELDFSGIVVPVSRNKYPHMSKIL